MSALVHMMATTTGDISASMTTTGSIIAQTVCEIKDGICNYRVMDPIASKAIFAEEVLSLRNSLLMINSESLTIDTDTKLKGIVRVKRNGEFLIRGPL